MMALVDLTTGPEPLFSLTAVQRKRVYSECGAIVQEGVDDALTAPRINKRPTQRAERHVRFANADIVTEINAVPEEVFPTLWYQDDDYQRMRQESKETIVMFEKKLGCSLDHAVCVDETYCLRGLEGIVGALVFRIWGHRNQKIVQSVLCQQQMLRQNGRTDDIEALRLSSTVISMFDKHKAWTRAQDSEKLVL
jgi:hypothetical protein